MTSPILFASYDGLLDPLGDSQFLRYIERVSRHDFKPIIITFEKTSSLYDHNSLRKIQDRIVACNCIWLRFKYHNQIPILASLFDIFIGSLAILYVLIRHKPALIYARSYMTSFMVLPALNFIKTPFVFDPRGFWPEEKVDANHWSSTGLVYKVVKWLESLIYSRANCVFVQTKAAHAITSNRLSLLNSLARVEIIPNSVDLNLFDPLNHVRCDSEFILGYVGSLGTWYLLDEMLNVFAELKRRLPSSRFVIINKNQHQLVFNRATALSVDTSSIDVISLSPLDVPKLVCTFDLAISLVKPCFSKLASSPTKIPEYLAMGVPVLSNSGVGDFESIFDANGVGITLSTFDSYSISDAVSEAILLARKPGIAYKCRNVARNYFSLDHAVLKMTDIFTRLCADRTLFV